jgi:hypothetical protein
MSVQRFRIEKPYYPIVYVRGYAMRAAEREETFNDTYYGFSATSRLTKSAQVEAGKPERVRPGRARQSLIAWPDRGHEATSGGGTSDLEGGQRNSR